MDDIDDIVASVLEPFSVGERNRVHVSGPNAHLAPNCAMMMSMMLHELATNAAKYGALSNESGEVLIEGGRSAASRAGVCISPGRSATDRGFWNPTERASEPR